MAMINLSACPFPMAGSRIGRNALQGQGRRLDDACDPCLRLVKKGQTSRRNGKCGSNAGCDQYGDVPRNLPTEANASSSDPNRPI
jgi:hypothetical protein